MILGEQMRRVFHLFYILFIFVGSYGCELNKCQVFTVIGKSKCTFDRKYKERVCVTKLGQIENMALKSIRGRSISTILPEPIEPYVSEVEMCIKDGKRIFNKL